MVLRTKMCFPTQGHWKTFVHFSYQVYIQKYLSVIFTLLFKRHISLQVNRWRQFKIFSKKLYNNRQFTNPYYVALTLLLHFI